MVFTSGIIIAFFCFAFFLIWDQFLKKDSRLSTGLQVLRKKMSELETLSLKVDDQVHRQMSVFIKKTEKLEWLLKKADTLCKQLEKDLDRGLVLKQKVAMKELSPQEKKSSSPEAQQAFQFGESPFEEINFVNYSKPKRTDQESSL